MRAQSALASGTSTSPSPPTVGIEVSRCGCLCATARLFQTKRAATRSTAAATQTTMMTLGDAPCARPLLSLLPVLTLSSSGLSRALRSDGRGVGAGVVGRGDGAVVGARVGAGDGQYVKSR